MVEKMDVMLRLFMEDRDFLSIVNGLDNNIKEQQIAGLTGSSRALYYAGLYKKSSRPLLIVTHNVSQAQKLLEDLLEFVSEEELLLYPFNELMFVEAAASSESYVGARVRALSLLARTFRGIIIAPAIGLRRLLPPKDVYAGAHRTVKIADSLQLEPLIEHLIEVGYERVERVETSGQLAIRGGIIDVFPASTIHPVRIELFDDEVDSIRLFDVENQRSLEKLKEVSLPPAKEMFASKDRFIAAAVTVEKLLKKHVSTSKDEKLASISIEKIGWEVEQLRSYHLFGQAFKYVTAIYPEKTTIVDYLSTDTIVVIDDPFRIQDSIEHIEKEEAEWQTTMLESGELIPGLSFAKRYQELWDLAPFPFLNVSLFLRKVPRTQPQNIVNVICKGMQNFHGQMHVLQSEVDRWTKLGMRILFTTAGGERAHRLQRILEDYKITTELSTGGHELKVGRPLIVEGNLLSGFEYPALKLIVITETEVFTQKQRKVRRLQKESNAERIKSYLELRVGDHVVHANHGIGKFLGIETLEIDGLHKDYLHVKYAGNDKLFVPIEQIDLVQKYIGSEEREPKVYSLGGGEWAKVKNRVKSSVQDIADDLIKLYAERQSTPGYAFSHDSVYQREFEALFPYDETVDQLRSIEEIKKDMEQSRPMDRLLCGDVGYGKTEVAVRAAFKAAMDGKQVALLCPTTILAQQHYETFRERFSGYPISIRVLSRFRSRKEQTETIKGVKAGTIDIVIGTHRLLSKDLQFKDIGLLIVDEEQRFGVSHKEKLKKLKMNVDVLTLTATPIPRTLHMSMLGVRDLSVIETPPENRFPVQTFVLEWSPALVKEVIERELARGGQVYFLYNQVKNIRQMADQISMLVPEARVAVGHGQLEENELERVMLDFLDAEYDVLVSTTIIETGVDIPNVNTLIIYDADKMGLSQLYQLRGRVGRSNRIAYAYFTYQRDKVLSEVAEKRLQAIKEFTELGSGFKIAMRDLAIRGAGNLLGAEQHGFIASVGFDLYSQMLKEAIEDRRGEKKVEEVVTNPVIELPIDAYLPDAYITDSMQKIEMYKKFASVRTLEQELILEEEIEDRFGELPGAVWNLLAVTKLKAYAIMYRVESVIQKGHEIVIKLFPDQNHAINGQKLFALANQFDGRMRLSSGQQIGITVKVKGLTAEKSMQLLIQFFEQYSDVVKQKGALQDVAT